METGWRYSSRVTIEWKWILKHLLSLFWLLYCQLLTRIGIANALEIISILYPPLSCIFSLFPYYIIDSQFVCIVSLLIPISFIKLQILKSFLVSLAFSCPLSGLYVTSYVIVTSCLPDYICRKQAVDTPKLYLYTVQSLG